MRCTIQKGKEWSTSDSSPYHKPHEYEYNSFLFVFLVPIYNLGPLYKMIKYNTGLVSSKVLVLGTWYLMQIIEYLLLTCTWSWNSKVLGTYLHLTAKVLNTCSSTQVLLSHLQIFSHKFVNLFSLTIHHLTHNQNYWNGSYWVDMLTTWVSGCQDWTVSLISKPSIETRWFNKVTKFWSVITGSGSGLSTVSSWRNPAGTRRNNVFTRSTRVDVVKTLSLRHYCVICPLGSHCNQTDTP